MNKHMNELCRNALAHAVALAGKAGYYCRENPHLDGVTALDQAHAAARAQSEVQLFWDTGKAAAIAAFECPWP